MPEDKVPYKEFAKKIKAKYPEYADVDDLELSKKMVEKHAEYKDQVSFDEPLKKKENTPLQQTSVSQSDSGSGISGLESGVSEQSNPLLNQPGQLSNNEVSYLQNGVAQLKKSDPKFSANKLPGQLNDDNVLALQKGVAALPKISENINSNENLPSVSTNAVGAQPMEKGENAESDLLYDLVNSFGRGTAFLGSSILRTPAYLYDISSESPLGKYDPNRLPTSSEIGDKLGIENTWAKKMEESYRESSDEFNKKYDQTLSEYLNPFGEKTDYKKGFAKLANQVTESLPITIGLMGATAAGVPQAGLIPLSGAVFGAGEKENLKLQHPDWDEEKLNRVSAVTGLLEGVTENMFGVVPKMGTFYSSLVKEKGKQVAESVMKEGLKKVLQKPLVQYGVATSEEIASEMANQLLDNYNKIYLGGDTTIKPMDGVVDAGIVAFGQAGPLTAPLLFQKNTAVSKDNSSKITQNEVKKEALEKDLVSEDVDPATKKILSKKIKDINEENHEILKADKQQFDLLPDEKKAEVKSLMKEVSDLHGAVLDPKVSEDTKESITPDIEAKEKEITKIMSESKPVQEEMNKELEAGHGIIEEEFNPESYREEQDNLIKKYVPSSEDVAGPEASQTERKTETENGKKTKGEETQETVLKPEKSESEVAPVSKDKIPTKEEVTAKFEKDLTDNYPERKKEYLDQHGTVFDTDKARELSEDYKKDPSEFVSAVHEPASKFVTKIYEEELNKEAPEGKNEVVSFMAGGPGVGKTRFVEASEKENHITVDTNLRNHESAVKDIDQALEKGKDVNIGFIYRDPYEAYVNGVISRAKHALKEGRVARTVPYELAVDIGKESAETIVRLSEDYKDEGRVNIDYWNNDGASLADVKPFSIDDVKKIENDYEDAKRRIRAEIDRQFEAGEIDENLYKGLIGEAKGVQNGSGVQGLVSEGQAENVVEPEKNVGKGKPQREDLVDEEEEADEAKPVSEEASKRLETDIQALKQITPANLVTKYNAIVRRADKMVEDGLLNKRTANQFKNVAGQVYDQKVKNIKGGITKVADDIKKKILGEYKGKVFSSILPVTPQMIEHLVDFGTKVMLKGVDAGLSLQSAIDNAVAALKEYSVYKKLVASGKLNEEEFKKEFADKFYPKQEEVNESEKGDEDLKGEPEKEAEGSKERRKKKAVSKNFLESVQDKKLKKALREEGVFYKVKGINPTTQNANDIIAVAEKRGELPDLEEAVIDKNSDVEPYMRGALAISLSKKRSDEWNDMNEDDSGREAVRKRFAQLHSTAASLATLAGQTSNYVGKVNKILFAADPALVVGSIKEGIAEKVSKELKKKKGLSKKARKINQIFEQTEKVVIPEEKLAKIRQKRDDAKAKLKSLFSSSGFAATPENLAKQQHEIIKQVAILATSYIEEGVLHAASLIKKLRLDYRDATGKHLPKDVLEKVFQEKHNGKTITEITDQYAEQRKREIAAAVNKSSKALSDVGLEKDSESQQVYSKVKSEIDKLNKTKDEVKEPEPKKGDTGLAKQLVDEVINDDESLSDFSKKQLLEDVMYHLETQGPLTSSDFKMYYGNALGISKFGPEAQAAVEKSLGVIREADKISRQGSRMISELIALQVEYKETPSKELKAKIDDLNKKVVAQTQKLFDAERQAAYANRDVSKHFKDFNPYAVVASNIQLNLLTTASIINNIVAYFPTAPIRTAVNTMASVIDLIRYKLAATAAGKAMGLKEERNFNRVKELKLGYQIGFYQGLKKAGVAFVKGNTDEGYQDRNTGYEYNAPAKLVEGFKHLKDNQKGSMVKAAKSLAEGIITFNPDFMGRLLTWGDAPVKEKNRIGAAISIAQKEGLEGSAALKYIFEPTSEQAEQIDQEAARASYQNDNKVSTWINGLFLSKVKELEKEGKIHAAGMLRIAKAVTFPFTKTPSNLVNELFEYMFPPYGLYRVYDHARNGNTRQAEISAAKVMAGIALTGVAYKLFAAGLLTTTGDEEDKKEKDIGYQTKKPGTINVNGLMRLLSGQDDWDQIKDSDTWITYEKLGVPGMILGTTANTYNRVQKTGVDIGETNLMMDMFRATPVAFSTALNQSFLKGGNEILNAVTDKSGNALDRLYVGKLGAVLAAIYPNTVSSISLSSEDYIKDKKTINGFGERLAFDLKEKFFSGDDLPNKIDVFGRPVTRVPDGENKYVYYMLNPTKSYEINTSSPEYKLFQFMESIPKDSESRLDVVPAQPRNEVEGKVLTGKNYEEFQKKIGHYRYKLLSLYVNSPVWEKDKEENKIDYLKQIWSTGFTYGKEEFIKENQEFKPETRGRKRKKTRKLASKRSLGEVEESVE